MLTSRIGTLVVTLIALAGLSAAGAVVAPRWEPPGLPAELGYPPLPPAPEADPAVAPARNGVRREDTSIVTPDETLAATVYAPVSAPVSAGRRPAVVLVHGSGAGKRDGLAGHAERLASAGIVALVYDKRTVGYSILTRDYRQLAQDALAGVRLLRQRSDVEPAMVGLWGVSEGGWVVSIAGSASTDVAFVILVSAAASSPMRQSTWALDTGMRRLGAPDTARQAAVRAFGMGGVGYVHHDAQPALRGLKVPVLAIYGTDDRAVPPVESPRSITGTLAASGNRSCTVRFFGGADHDLRVGGELAPGYPETMANWIRGLPASGTPRAELQAAGATPNQEFLSADVPATGWTAAGLAAAYLLIAAGYLAAPVAGLIRRLPRRPRPPPAWPRLRSRLRWLTASGVVMLLSLNATLATLVALTLAQAPGGWAVDGGWLAVRLLAVLTVLLLVSALAAVVSGRRAGWRPGGLERVRVVGVCTATSVALLVAAYWGLFAPAW